MPTVQAASSSRAADAGADSLVAVGKDGGGGTGRR